jgi:hypothetical protein
MSKTNPTPEPEPTGTLKPATTTRAPNSVLWLLHFAIKTMGFQNLGQLQKEFGRAIDKAKANGHADRYPTRAEFDRATAKISKTALLSAIYSNLQR